MQLVSSLELIVVLAGATKARQYIHVYDKYHKVISLVKVQNFKVTTNFENPIRTVVPLLRLAPELIAWYCTNYCGTVWASALVNNEIINLQIYDGKH